MASLDGCLSRHDVANRILHDPATHSQRATPSQRANRILHDPATHRSQHARQFQSSSSGVRGPVRRRPAVPVADPADFVSEHDSDHSGPESDGDHPMVLHATEIDLPVIKKLIVQNVERRREEKEEAALEALEASAFGPLDGETALDGEGVERRRLDSSSTTTQLKKTVVHFANGQEVELSLPRATEQEARRWFETLKKTDNVEMLPGRVFDSNQPDRRGFKTTRARSPIWSLEEPQVCKESAVRREEVSLHTGGSPGGAGTRRSEKYGEGARRSEKDGGTEKMVVVPQLWGAAVAPFPSRQREGGEERVVLGGKTPKTALWGESALTAALEGHDVAQNIALLMRDRVGGPKILKGPSIAGTTMLEKVCRQVGSSSSARSVAERNDLFFRNGGYWDWRGAPAMTHFFPSEAVFPFDDVASTSTPARNPLAPSSTSSAQTQNPRDARPMRPPASAIRTENPAPFTFGANRGRGKMHELIAALRTVPKELGSQHRLAHRRTEELRWVEGVRQLKHSPLAEELKGTCATWIPTLAPKRFSRARALLGRVKFCTPFARREEDYLRRMRM